jgi:predicted Zn-dependent protease
MIGHERAKEALAWLAALPTAMRNTMPIPLAEADGFVAVRDWPGLETRLQEQRWDDQEFIRLALLARALRGQHQNAVANAVWRRAVSAAGTRAGFTAALAQVALGWGWNTEAEDLLWAAAKREPQNDWPLQTLARSYSLTNDTAGMYRVHQALLERHPKSDVLKNNVAMFALLLNRDLPRATGLAREVCEAAKTNAFFVSTYAFALHRQGKTAEGLHLMQTLPETELQRPEIAIYYAVLLSATGAQERAKVYVAAAEKARMLPEERRLLAEAK